MVDAPAQKNSIVLPVLFIPVRKLGTWALIVDLQSHVESGFA